MDFSIPETCAPLQERTRAFIRDQIIPLEGDKRQTAHGPTDAFRRELNALAAGRRAARAACRRPNAAGWA